jgi:SAM-dependent methyltransferase
VSDLPSMKDFWNRTAKKFGDKDGYRPVLMPSSKGLLNWYTDFLQNRALKKHLDSFSAQFVLDIGCGVGRWSARLATLGSTVIGIDLSREMAKRAKSRLSKRNLKGDFVVASVEKLPFIPNLFDSILSVTVLQHNVEKSSFDSAVSEILRIIRMDGTLVLLEYTYDSSKKFTEHFPTVAHNYEEAFASDKKLSLINVEGVDLSLFLKPFNRVVKKRGKYKDSLEDSQPSSKYRLLASSFYFFASIACLISLPLDIPLRNVLKKYSEHTIFVFSANKNLGIKKS